LKKFLNQNLNLKYLFRKILFCLLLYPLIDDNIVSRHEKK
jgi:hypothetical protein